MTENPIIRAWDEYPEARKEFIVEVLVRRYKSLIKGICDEVDSYENFKVGGTD